MCVWGVGFHTMTLEALEKFVVLFGDARCPLPISLRVFVKIAGVTIVADFRHDGWLYVHTPMQKKKMKSNEIEKDDGPRLFLP